MKKLTTLFAFMLSTFFVSAQDVVFTNNGNVLEDEATINADAYEDLEWNEAKAETQGVNANGDKYPNQLFLKNQSSEDQPIRLTITTLSKENVKSIGICTLDQCSPITEEIEKRDGILNNEGGELNSMLKFDAFFTLGTPGHVKLKVVLNVGLASRTLYVNLNYTPGGSGIHSEKNDAVISKSGNNIIYKLAGAGQHTIDVYNITGSLVKSTEVGQEGTLSLEDLSKGIYIYTAKTNGKQVAVQKCIIK